MISHEWGITCTSHEEPCLAWRLAFDPNENPRTCLKPNFPHFELKYSAVGNLMFPAGKNEKGGIPDKLCEATVLTAAPPTHCLFTFMPHKMVAMWCERGLFFKRAVISEWSHNNLRLKQTSASSQIKEALFKWGFDKICSGLLWRTVSGMINRTRLWMWEVKYL